MQGESYLVRIYRRGEPGSTATGATLVGIVEETSSGVRRRFHDMDELWAILCETKSSTQDTCKGDER